MTETDIERNLMGAFFGSDYRQAASNSTLRSVRRSTG